MAFYHFYLPYFYINFEFKNSIKRLKMCNYKYYTSSINTKGSIPLLYYCFGSVLADRTKSIEEGYGFGGQENEVEISGNRNQTTAKFWEYLPRTGRRWNRDPVVDHSISSYATNEGNPIKNDDQDGDCPTCPPPNVNIVIGIPIGSHNNGIKFNLWVIQNIGDFSLLAGIGLTKIAINSDRYVRHPIQDMFAHNLPGTKQPGFQTLSKSVTPFYQGNTQNLFKPISTPRFTLYD